MPQTSIQYRQRQGFEGQIITHTPHVVRSAAEGFYSVATGVLPYGRVVIVPTTPVPSDLPVESTPINLPSATGQKVAGITVINDWNPVDEALLYQNNPEIGVKPKDPVSVLTSGDVLVWSEVAVKYNDAAFFRFTAAAAPNDKVGRFSNVAGAGFDPFPNAKFGETTTGPGLVILKVWSY